MSNGQVASPPGPSRPQPPASPRSPTLLPQIVLDEPGIEFVAREAGQKPMGKPAPWAGDRVDYDAEAVKRSEAVPNDGIVRIGAQAPSPAGPSISPTSPPPGLSIVVKGGQRLGLYSVPIEWKLEGTTSATLGPANPSMTVGIVGRARLSAWAAPNNLWIDEKANPKRFARDRWKGLDDRWGLDDVTFTQTVRLMDPASKAPEGAPLINGKPDPDAVWWSGNFLPGLSDADRTSWMKDAIQFFHARKIQVFAGYEIVTQDWTTLVPPDPAKTKDKKELEKLVAAHNAKVNDMKRNRAIGNAFVRWLETKGGRWPDFESHAKKLVGFFDDRGLDIDGISYDLEIDAKNSGVGLGRRHADGIQALYIAVALQLALKERYLAFAAAGRPDSTIMQEQPYSLGTIINILVRTMSYEVPADKGKRYSGRESVIRDSLDKLNLHPSHLQIGLTTRSGQPGKISTDNAKTEAGTLRKYRVGLIHWYLDVLDLAPEQYKDYDQALNASAPPRGTRGQPLHGPLGPQRLKAFTDARAAETKEQGGKAAG